MVSRAGTAIGDADLTPYTCGKVHVPDRRSKTRQGAQLAADPVTRLQLPFREIQLRCRAHQWEELQGHLFPGDSDEHGAVLLCGQAVINGKLHLLVRELLLAIDGKDYLPGIRGHRHLTGEFVTRSLRRAKDAGLVYLAVHNHDGIHRVAFSSTDLGSHERGYPTLARLSGNAVGGLVLTRRAIAGDIWLADGQRMPVDVTLIVGDELTALTDGHQPRPSLIQSVTSQQHARQALIFGDAGQVRLREMTVGVVGCGGIGMLVIQALSRLGVGNFVVIDPDSVSTTNLSRLPEARLRDAVGLFGSGWVGRAMNKIGLNQPTMKVHHARKIIRGANPLAKVVAVTGDVANDKVARELLDCDFLFLAADTMLARDVVNQLSYQYLIPTLQVGSKVVVERATGKVLDVYSVVRSLGTAAGCLRCNGLVNLSKLAEEVVGDERQRQNQRYVDEPDVVAPSVITLNSMTAGWAVNDFMQYATGLGRPSGGFRLLRSRPAAPGHAQLVVQMPHADPDCHVCGSGLISANSRGDGMDLPTRIIG